MVSRSNLSGRPGMGGVLGKVFKPQRQRPPKVSVPTETGGAGLSGMVRRSQGRAGDAGGILATLAQGVNPTAPEAGQRGRRKPLQAMRAQAQGQRAGLEELGATQAEVAGSRGMVERAAAGARRPGSTGQLLAQEQAAEQRAVSAETGEVGGTVTENPVTEPSLNQARRSRSRSGRIYRR